MDEVFMYKKDFEFYEIEYNEYDIPYIDKLIESLNSNFKRIMDFLELAKNQEVLRKESPRLFYEAKEWLNKRKNR